MRVLFLNQYFPPDPAPTGILFAELAEECRARGHDVDFADAGQDYRSAAQSQKGGRMKRELAALRRMLSTGKARARPDVVISGSSPPCLAVFADRVARKHRAPHFHWAMDVYPEIAVALGEIKRGGIVARLTAWLMGRAYRRCARVVALDADMAAVLARHHVQAEVIRPWISRDVLAQLRSRMPEVGSQPAHPTSDLRPLASGTSFACLYSGNLGRAHDYETLLRAQRLLEDRGPDYRLVFQGGGPGTPAAQALAQRLGLQRCEWKPYAPAAGLVSSLLESDVLAVTQRPETQGLLWPSKLGLITALARPILFIGPIQGAIAADLRLHSHAGIFAPGDHTGVADWLEKQRANPASAVSVADPATRRAESIAHWLRLIEAA
jgi:glycosyltransferase involved in cell wall biosynthesis